MPRMKGRIHQVKYTSAGALRARVAAAMTIALSVILAVGVAHAQLAGLYPDFLTFQNPGQLQATLFGGGFASDQYGTTQEGFQLDQSITPYIGAFGRATAYQVYSKGNQLNPFLSGSAHQSNYNFGVFQGGLDFMLYPGTDFFLSGGADAGDARGALIEGDFSSWINPHSRHPLNFSFSSIHTFGNGVTSSEIDFQWVLKSTEDWMFLGGAGGAIFGGSVNSSSVNGQGGPDLGCFYRPWRIGLSAQAGYGAAHNYGQLSIYKQLGWTE